VPCPTISYVAPAITSAGFVSLYFLASIVTIATVSGSAMVVSGAGVVVVRTGEQYRPVDGAYSGGAVTSCRHHEYPAGSTQLSAPVAFVVPRAYQWSPGSVAGAGPAGGSGATLPGGRPPTT
jgi:hypothetical protein